jgi:hypothetical protein
VDGEGWLAGVRETLEIGGRVGDLNGQTVAGEEVALTGEEPISTNFWLFSPQVFPLLASAFREFFSAQLQGESAPPEFLIPTVMNTAIEGGTARVRTTPTRGRFLGITHPEDRHQVVGSLARMAEDGWYPAPMWGRTAK